jgi:hypothetical protein
MGQGEKNYKRSNNGKAKRKQVRKCSEPLKLFAKRWQQNMSLLNADLISKLEKTVSTFPLAPSVMCSCSARCQQRRGDSAGRAD